MALGCQDEGFPIIDPPASCDVEAQKSWIYDTMDEVYLWSSELPARDEVDFASYETPEDLTRALRQNVDRWTRAVDKVTSDALFMEGMRIGLGFKYGATDDGNFVLKLVHPGSPAGNAGLRRGDVLLSVNGTAASEATGSDWGPNDEGAAVTFEVIAREDVGQPDATPTELTVIRDWYKIVTVPVSTVLNADTANPVGYFYFDTFVETSIEELDAAFNAFEEAGVTGVVVDMRYNGGGLIATARHLMNLLGAAQHAGETAYRVEYNENLSDQNSSYSFGSVSAGLSLDRIAFITSGSTASASELVINALLPYIDTEIVGAPTAGKPVGSNSFEFCEKLLFPITFQLVNSQGDGSYFDGMTPGCGGEDQPAYELGDPNESLLANAMAFMETGTCSAFIQAPVAAPPTGSPADDPLFDVHQAR